MLSHVHLLVKKPVFLLPLSENLCIHATQGQTYNVSIFFFSQQSRFKTKAVTISIFY